MALDGFFGSTKPQTDNFEQWEQRQGLKPMPPELAKHLSSEYAQESE